MKIDYAPTSEAVALLCDFSTCDAYDATHLFVLSTFCWEGRQCSETNQEVHDITELLSRAQ